VAFSDKVRTPATGGGPASGWRGERKLGSTVHVEKAARGGARGSAHRGGFRDGGGRRTAAVARSTGARRSDGDVFGFGHGRWRGRDGACETRRGGGGSVAAFLDTAGRDNF
jgi:hypothetical protein